MANLNFSAEKATALNTFNVFRLQAFLYENAFELVGEKQTSRGTVYTTLEEEVADVVRLAHAAYIGDGINIYNRKAAFRAVETSEEEIKKRSENAYRKAANKLLWLSSKCKEMTTKGFVQVKVDKSDLSQCESLVDSFEFVVRNYEILLEEEGQAQAV